MNNDKSKILIVDDTAQNIQLLVTLLKEQYKLLIAKDGEQSLRTIEKSIPDLILLDVNMPGLNGFEVCKIIKRDVKTKDIPIIFLTARAETEDIVKGFEAGGSDYLTKPFRKEELMARITTHLNLRKKELELLELNTTKDRFFSIIAHDLKNPFTGLIGLSDLILQSYKSIPEQKLLEMMKSLNEASKNGYKLLENLLEWSRSQTNTIKFNPVKFNTKEIIVQTYHLVQNLAIQKNIKIILELNDTGRVFADTNMILTVLRNLVTNAIKYTTKGGEIKIQSNIEEDRSTISIIDNGVGIPKENINKLFDIGSKFSNPGTENEKGTGIGLILCKEFLDKNNGTIMVNSQPDMGSTFTFTLPLSLD